MFHVLYGGFPSIFDVFDIFMRNKCFLSCIFDVIFNVFDMRNKCIQNDIKTQCFFLFAFKMSLSKPKHQHIDRTLKEKIEILGKLVV